MDDEKKSEEQTPSFLEQVKAERISLEKVRDENKAIVAQMEQFRAEQILSGKADAGQTPPKPAEETPAEYAKRIMSGGK